MKCPMCRAEVELITDDLGELRIRQHLIWRFVRANCPASGKKVSVCPRCEGTGRYQRGPFDGDKPCAICNGTGLMDVAVEVAVNEAAFAKASAKVLGLPDDHDEEDGVL